MPSCAVLHITSLAGGGVDRHVRDVARSSARAHFVWHVGERAEVLQLPGPRYLALDPASVERESEALPRWLHAKGAGVVHVHSLHRQAKGRARQARTAGLGLIATLHDVLFLREDAFERDAAIEPDPAWLEDNARFLGEANAVVAPSDYIAELARRHIPGLEVNVIANGSAVLPPAQPAPRARDEFLRERPRHVVAVLGAIGPHKGSDVLESLAPRLAGSGIALVVIGYLDRQILPGWRFPGTCFIHGSWSDEDVAQLLEAYGAELVLFPNQVPESFSYALSDAWSCGIPVLAAPYGALGERVGRHGGGWLLPGDFDASVIEARLRELFTDAGSRERARVKSTLSHRDPARVPPLQSMARSLDALYARFGVPPESPLPADGAALERLLAANLDGSVFRVELARLADELGQSAASNAELQSEIARARQFESDSREWIAKLERDIAALKAEVGRQVAERNALEAQNIELRVNKAALERLPSLLRRYLLKISRDARS